MQSTNPNAPPSVSIFSLGSTLSRHRHLIIQMTRREIVGRYKGSVFGLAWSFFHPVLMLLVYTFVFSEIFGSRWTEASSGGGKTQFALVLFVGMIVLNFFSDVLNRAPFLVLSNVNYVKKVVFPIEVLPVIASVTALFHAAVHLGVLLLALAISNSHIPWTAVLFPLIFLPLFLVALGLAWALAALGVYMRDVGHTVGVVTTVLMFLSPVFYPVSAVPVRFQPYIMANPLTFIIEQSRNVLIWERTPDWHGLGLYSAIAAALSWAGFAWFQKTRKGFADVI